MSRNPKMYEFEVESKPLRGRNKVFDNDAGTFLGRTPRSWGKLLLFYLVFYSVLIALFAVCMATFLQHFIDPRIPYLKQDEGLIGASPGLGFRPHPPDVRSTLIWYKGTSAESYKYWKDQLIEFTEDYKKKGKTAGTGQNIYNCGFDNPPPFGKVCDVEVRDWHPCTVENNFSFHRSKPCIFFKLNRIYNWRPEYLDVNNLPLDMPFDLKNSIRGITANKTSYNQMVWFSCQGETPADQENIGKLTYYPYPGFPGYYFPYTNAEGYLSPLIAVHFTNPQPGIIINVECRAWARNIQYNRREKVGVVHFELMIE